MVDRQSVSSIKYQVSRLDFGYRILRFSDNGFSDAAGALLVGAFKPSNPQIFYPSIRKSNIRESENPFSEEISQSDIHTRCAVAFIGSHPVVKFHDKVFIHRNP